MEITEVFDKFRDTARYQSLSPATRKEYEFSMSVIAGRGVLGQLPRDVNKVQPIDLLKTIADQRLTMSESRKHKIGVMFKVVMEWACEEGLRQEPFHYSRKKGWKSIPIPAWRQEHIFKYIHYDRVTADVRAVALLYYTGQRVGDVLKMKYGDVDVSRNCIHVVQEKTGKHLWVPLHPALQHYTGEVFTAQRNPHNPYIVTSTMQKMSYDALRKVVIAKCEKMGVKPTPLHGLRKAAAVRMAEAGCTPHEIMSITGHSSLKEVERYTLEVDQERLAKEAMKKMVEAEPPIAEACFAGKL